MSLGGARVSLIEEKISQAKVDRDAPQSDQRMRYVGSVKDDRGRAGSDRCLSPEDWYRLRSFDNLVRLCMHLF